MRRRFERTPGIEEVVATALAALSAVLASYAGATAVGPTPIPSIDRTE